VDRFIARIGSQHCDTRFFGGRAEIVKQALHWERGRPARWFRYRSSWVCRICFAHLNGCGRDARAPSEERHARHPAECSPSADEWFAGCMRSRGPDHRLRLCKSWEM